MDKKMEMDNNRKIATNNPSQRCHRPSEEELAMNKVLDMSMMDLKYILHPFHCLCQYLSCSENLQEFSGECGHTYREWLVYDAMIKTQPNKLPAKTFLEIFFRDSPVTLRKFMEILMSNLVDWSPPHFPLFHFVETPKLLHPKIPKYVCDKMDSNNSDYCPDEDTSDS